MTAQLGKVRKIFVVETTGSEVVGQENFQTLVIPEDCRVFTLVIHILSSQSIMAPGVTGIVMVLTFILQVVMAMNGTTLEHCLLIP